MKMKPAKRGTIIWDFDGTLTHRPYKWSGSLHWAIHSLEPNNPVQPEDLAKHTAIGFPWHSPEVDHPHLNQLDAWWAHMNEILGQTLQLHLQNKNHLKEALSLTKKALLDPQRYQLFEDVIPHLIQLKKMNWEHVVLTNNFPDIEELVKGLGLSNYFEKSFSSAFIGYEKPRKEIYEYVLDHIEAKNKVWMIGDNEMADAWGSESAGLNAILLRNPPKTFHRFAKDIGEACRLIDHDFIN